MLDTITYTAADFRQRATEHNTERPGLYGDHRLNPSIKGLILKQEPLDAAILVPVINRDSGATVLLTERSAHLRKHPGQIAFPGGRCDAGDFNAQATALRETQEEIGIDPALIEIVGEMPNYLTGSGYRIRPILSVLQPGFELGINRDEVESVFEVPLSFLMNPVNHQQKSRMFQGHERFFLSMPYGDWHIWGVTAGIVHMLYERLYT